MCPAIRGNSTPEAWDSFERSVEKGTPKIGMPRVFGWSREFVVIIKQRRQTRRARQLILVGKGSPIHFMRIGVM